MLDTYQIVAIIFGVIVALSVSMILIYCREGCKCCCIKRDVGVVTSDEEKPDDSSDENNQVKTTINDL